MTGLRIVRIFALALGSSAMLAAAAPAEMTVREDAIGYALENLVSGTSTTISFGETSVSVTPLRTWKSVSGHWCRRYELVIAGAGEAPEQSRATRCRQDGIWKPIREE